MTIEATQLLHPLDLKRYPLLQAKPQWHQNSKHPSSSWGWRSVEAILYRSVIRNQSLSIALIAMGQQLLATEVESWTMRGRRRGQTW